MCFLGLQVPRSVRRNRGFVIGKLTREDRTSDLANKIIRNQASICRPPSKLNFSSRLVIKLV